MCTTLQTLIKENLLKGSIYFAKSLRRMKFLLHWQAVMQNYVDPKLEDLNLK